MRESIYVGAYWSARIETAEQSATRVWSVLDRIKQISPLLGSWYPKKRTIKEPTGPAIETMEDVKGMLSRNRNETDGGIIEELGFSFGAWNGEYEESKGLSISSHMGAISTRVKNRLVLNLPGEPYRLTEQHTQKVFEIVIEETRPDYATVSSNQCRTKIQKKNEFVFGWMGYLKGAPDTRPSLEIESYVFADGTVFAATVDQFSSENETHIVTAKELNRIMTQAGWKP
jgi:hypothetical protein